MKISNKIAIIDVIEKYSDRWLDHLQMGWHLAQAIEYRNADHEWYPNFYRMVNDINYVPKILYYPKTIIDKMKAVKWVKTAVHMLKEIKSDTGIIIVHKRLSFVYEIRNRMYTCFAVLDDKVIAVSTINSKGEIESPQVNPDNQEINDTPAMMIALLTLYYYADIETKVIAKGTPNRRAKINNEKYISDSPVKVQIVDSMWFTEIIRTEGFTVSGHFRFQPYGEGKKKRKLIWISEFEKHGYHRKAGIQNIES